MNISEIKQKIGQLSSEDSLEADILYGHLKKLREKYTPRVNCCKAAKLFPAVFFSVEYGKYGDTDKGKGYWQAHVNVQELNWSKIKEFPAAKFCPYCGKNLPKMRRRRKRLEDVCRVTDGGYYCDTCSRRLSTCICLPIEANFESYIHERD